MTGPVRIGTLGAARITPNALTKPARIVDDAVVTAVAARDVDRARAFANKHGIERVHGSYDDIINDPDVDAIYNPLPNSHHGPWTLKAIAAGKHVLCEKPFTSNAAEAEQVKAAADAAPNLVVMEAFHYRYHATVARMLELIADGAVGRVQHIRTAMCFPLPSRKDIRWQLALAGGSLMDAGCYAVHLLRTLGGSEPTVVSARAKERSPGVDRWMQAEFRFDSGATGRITTGMLSARIVDVSARVVGDKGEIRVLNPFAPQVFSRFKVNGRREKIGGEGTYTCQLRAFTGAVLRNEPILTPPSTAVANMRVIDDIYAAAGMQPRPALPSAG
ncbi:MAG TPA: Gfo/Idh/MocA family oxidoreductase [Acidimicrobiales bacterium]|nr:Gfo/Idh/MocA family oxidoreductase [Acidimicrobiales bacterium]